MRLPAPALLLLALLSIPFVGPTIARAGSSSAPASSGQEPMVVAGITRLAAGKTAPVQVTLVVPPGYKVYKDMLVVEVLDAGDLALGEPSLPAGILAEDPAAPGSQREQYEFDVIIELPMTRAPAPGSHKLSVSVRWQACRASVCLYPKTEQVQAEVLVSAATAG